MMKSINQKIKQSLSIHQKIRSAQFISYGTETFKYKLHTIFKSGRDRFRSLKSIIHDKLVKLYNGVIWCQLIDHACIWVAEGLTINYALYVLFGFPFNIFTIFAYGILIKQGIDIYNRMKDDGSINTIPKKD